MIDATDVTVPSTFYFKDHTKWNNATGEIKTATTTTAAKTSAKKNNADDADDDSSTKTLINGIAMTQSSLEKIIKKDMQSFISRLKTFSPLSLK